MEMEDLLDIYSGLQYTCDFHTLAVIGNTTALMHINHSGELPQPAMTMPAAIRPLDLHGPAPDRRLSLGTIGRLRTIQ